MTTAVEDEKHRGMHPGERWFVGATASVLLIDAFLALFVVAAVLGGGERTPWASKTPWLAVAPVGFVLSLTLALAQGAYAGSRRARNLDLAWSALQILATLPVVLLVAVGLGTAIARGEPAVPWAVLLPVPALRLAVYVFLAWALGRSPAAQAFLDAQAAKRVPLFTFGTVVLLAVAALSLLAMAAIPFVG